MPSGVDALLYVLLGGPRVQLGEGGAQAAFENRLVEVVPLREAGNFRVTGNVVPAHGLKLFAKWNFNFIQFSLFSAHPLASVENREAFSVRSTGFSRKVRDPSEPVSGEALAAGFGGATNRRLAPCRSPMLSIPPEGGTTNR